MPLFLHQLFKHSVVVIPLGVCMVYMIPWPLPDLALDIDSLVSSLAVLPLLASPILLAFSLEASDCFSVRGILPSFLLRDALLRVSLTFQCVQESAFCLPNR